MSLLLASLILVGLLFLLLAIGVYVGLALLLVGLAGLAFFTSAPTGPNLATALWTSTSGWSLAALPLFVWMGEILYRSRLAQGLFQGLSPLLSPPPGGASPRERGGQRPLCCRHRLLRRYHRHRGSLHLTGTRAPRLP